MTTEEKWHSVYWHKLDREEAPLKRRIVENEAEHKELTDKLRQIASAKAAEDGEQAYSE